MSKKEFVNGFIVKPPKEGAPSFVKCSVSIRREELGNWLSERTGEWINIDVKESKEGKWYAEVNNWKPKASGGDQGAGRYAGNGKDQFDDDIPF